MSEFNPETVDEDPGLTAFALGELEGAEAEHFVDQVRRSPQLQALVQQIQSEAKLLSEELRLEPVEPLTSDRRAAIVAHAAVALPTHSTVTRASRRSHWIRWLAMTAGSAAVITGIAISLPRAKTSTVAYEMDVSRNMQPIWAGPGAAGSGPEHTAQGVQADQRSSTALGMTPEDRFGDSAKNESKRESSVRDRIHGVTDELMVEGPTSAVATTAAPAVKDAEPQDQTEHRYDRSVQSLSQLSTVRMTIPDTSEAELPRPAGRPSRPASGAGPSSIRVLDASSESKPVSGPQTAGGSADDLKIAGRRMSKSSGNESTESTKAEEKDSATLSDHEIGDTVTGVSNGGGDKSESGARGRVSNKGSDVFNGSKPATISDSVWNESGKSTAKAKSKRKENLAGEPAGMSVALSKAGDSAPETRDRGFKGLSDQPEGESQKQEDRKKFYSEHMEAKKTSEYAYLELSRARESERLRPGSVPLEELQKLERLSEVEARQRRLQTDPTGAEAYLPIFENSFVSPAKEPQSTFSIDVDSASYSNMRRFLLSGQVPPPDAIRIEELINYFSYQYPVPQDGKPFSVNTDIAACPWNPGHHLVRIGLKGKEIAKDQRPPSSLVFLVDVSGSMSAENKLPLVKSSLKTLVSQLDERDRIAIVTYAGEAGLRLPATSVAHRETILTAIDGLGAGGSTNGAAGINTAYDIAAKEFVEKGTNRVILCTDGDFNVGVTTNEALEAMIATRAKSGVFLSVFGFGMGNLKDGKLEQLADKGNGQYGYIDDRQEADKVFVQELSGTLITIAKDVKIQIDFDNEAVASYRLVGYENRVLATEDFNNDKKDAGEIGAGHTVTALYEIVPVKDLKPNDKTRWMNVKLRYKQPEAATSELIENPLIGQPGQLKLAPSDFQFAAAVASFGMLLRNSQHAGQANWGMVKELAQSGLSNDQYGHRSGFRRLIDQAESLVGERRPAAPPEPESTVNGKYKSLLRRLNVPEDAAKYGQFNDYGFDQTKTYGGSENLPEGYWVYVAPYWYIWGEMSQK